VTIPRQRIIADVARDAKKVLSDSPCAICALPVALSRTWLIILLMTRLIDIYIVNSQVEECLVMGMNGHGYWGR
jgi:hypothetical protein